MTWLFKTLIIVLKLQQSRSFYSVEQMGSLPYFWYAGIWYLQCFGKASKRQTHISEQRTKEQMPNKKQLFGVLQAPKMTTTMATAKTPSTVTTTATTTEEKK